MILDKPVLVPDPHPTLPVTRRHHLFDFEDSLERFEEHRAKAMWCRRVAYVGPRVVVQCDRPTPRFWRAVYAEKGAWFRVARNYFPRSWLENPKQWFDPMFTEAPLAHLQEHRKACVTGEVLIGSTSVRPRYWPSPEEVGYRAKATKKAKKPGSSASPTSPSDRQATPADWRLRGKQ